MVRLLDGGVIALLIVGAAVLPLHPRLLGCKYGEHLSEKPMAPLGQFGGKGERRMLCNDGPGDVLAFESFEVVCERAVAEVHDAVCVPVPTGYKP